MNLLLLSNSTNAGEEYLGWPRPLIKSFLEQYGIKKCLFIPYAGVTISWNNYTERVSNVFAEFGCQIESIHHAPNPVEAVENAACIVVGGGNTFRLVQCLHEQKVMQPIRNRVLNGLPFMGWSAGSNIACPTLRTTNDMPVIEPASFETLNLIPFQINPHYLDAHPDGHGGETREDRILEFLELNRKTYVVGLREGCALAVEGESIKLLGNRPMRVFQYHAPAYELETRDDLSFLMREMVV